MPESNQENKVRLARRVRFRDVAGQGVLVQLEEGRVLVVNEVGLYIVQALSRQAMTESELADAVARRLRGHGLRARTITLKYRDETFRTLTRAETVPEPTDAGDALFRTVWRLFEGVHGERRVRLVDLRLHHFAEHRDLRERGAWQISPSLKLEFGHSPARRKSALQPNPIVSRLFMIARPVDGIPGRITQGKRGC